MRAIRSLSPDKIGPHIHSHKNCAALGGERKLSQEPVRLVDNNLPDCGTRVHVIGNRIGCFSNHHIKADYSPGYKSIAAILMISDAQTCFFGYPQAPRSSAGGRPDVPLNEISGLSENSVVHRTALGVPSKFSAFHSHPPNRLSSSIAEKQLLTASSAKSARMQRGF